MKFRYLLLGMLFFCMIACVHGEAYTPDEGIFAFREVDTFEINGINFTVPTDYEITDEDETHMNFKHDQDKLKISVVKDGKVKKVKNDKSKNITSGKTMLGSVEGYLVDKNGTYTFSYKEGDKLVVVKSKDMSLMMGVIGKD